jgi:GNAT superfamily N-acetyltransferase
VSGPEWTILELAGAELAATRPVYETLGFEMSEPGIHRTFAMKDAGGLAALGRLARYADGALEIGGFWVREDLRGHGLARRMVARVLAQAPGDRPVYCLPFASLVDFYRSFGLVDAGPPASLPDSIAAKVGACAAGFPGRFLAGSVLVRPGRPCC